MRIIRWVGTCITVWAFTLFAFTGIAFSGTPDTIEKIAALAVASPTSVAVDAAGNIYVADTNNHSVIMASSVGTTILTIGSGAPGFVPSTGSTGLNTTLADVTIQLNSPGGVALDSSGNLFISDTGNHRVHMIFADPTTKLIGPTSKIITIAGSGIAGFSGDGGLSNIASLNNPTGLAVDPSGNVYVADNGNYRVRKFPAVKIGTTGTLTFGSINTIAGDGKATTMTAYGIALSPAPAGDLYIADSGNNRVLKLVSAKGTPTVVAGTGLAGFSGDGGLAINAQLNQPSGVATDGKDLYVADTLNNCIRKVSIVTGVIATRVGSVAQAAHIVPIPPVLPLSYPMGVGLNASGTLYIADSGNSIIDQVYASVSAITTVDPPGGTYSISKTLTLTASKAASISYRINAGAVTPYTGPFTISGPATTTLTFSSLDYAGHQEVTNTAIYKFDSAAPTTTASIDAAPVNGIYISAKVSLNVTLTASTPDATIYYFTTASATPIKYTSPISLPVTSTQTSTTIQFYSVDAVGNKESTQSVTFKVLGLNTSASPVGGAYRSAQIVSLTANDASSIVYYTTDGSEPTTASAQYNPALHISIGASTELKFRAKDANGNLEQTKYQYYTIDAVAPNTIVSPVGTGLSYAGAQTVTLTTDDRNATIFYTLDGTSPTTASLKYTAPLVIAKTTTLMYFAMDVAGNREAIKKEIYTIDEIAPVTTASLISGKYASNQSVTLNCDDPKATIYFTTDGTTPTTSSSKYTLPLLISGTTKLQFFAMDSSGNSEGIKEYNYEIYTLASSANPKGGYYNTAQVVELATNGSQIYYTVNNGTVTDKDVYKGERILIQNPGVTIIRFYSVDANGVKENLKTETYTLDYVLPNNTTVTCGATNTIKLIASDDIDLAPRIKYIANTSTGGGAIPAYTLTDYTGPVTYTNNTIIKFFATDIAGNTELIKTAYCPDMVVPLDPKPSLYLETLANGATTSNSTIFINGNVAPFTTTTLDINGTTVVVDPNNGAFTHTITTPTLVAGANVITTTATNGVQTTVDARTITYGGLTTPTSIVIGKSNVVIGHSGRFPITLTSGFQAAALSIDLSYDTTTSRLDNPKLIISESAAARGKIIQGTGNPATGVFRILIMDDPGSSTFLPLPDGVVGYIIFSAPFNSTGGPETLQINDYSATDPEANLLPVQPIIPAMHGVANIVSKPGNSIYSLAGDTSPTLKGVQDSLYMLLDPAHRTVDGSVDLNADGQVQMFEFLRVINTFLGLN